MALIAATAQAIETRTTTYDFTDLTKWTTVPEGTQPTADNDYEYLCFGQPAGNVIMAFEKSAYVGGTTMQFTSGGFNIGKAVKVHLPAMAGAVNKIVVNFSTVPSTTTTFYLNTTSNMRDVKKDATTTSFTLTGSAQLEDNILWGEGACVIKDIKVTYTITNAPVNKTMNEYGIATCCYAAAYTMPEGYDGYSAAMAEGEEATVELTKTWPSGSTVPAGTPLIMKGPAGDYSFTYSDATPTPAPEACVLRSNLIAGMIPPAGTGEYQYYKLAQNDGNDPNDTSNFGFYWGAEDGGRFSIGARKAYLAIPASQSNGAKSLRIAFPDEQNGVRTARATLIGGSPAYDLLGRPIATPPAKGLYIQNGKLQSR